MSLKHSVVFEGRSLSLERGAKKLFQDLSFSLFSKESLVLFGKNGSGKTSLLRVMATLLRPTRGEIFWKHKKLTFLDPHFRQNLIYIGHELGLKTNINVLEMLSFFKDISNSPLSVDGIISYWKLEEFKNHKISELSMGSKKRVALCRLSLDLHENYGRAENFLWLLDEPFANLDSFAQQKLCEVFKNHSVRGGVLVFSSHQDQLFPVSHRIHLKNESFQESHHE